MRRVETGEHHVREISLDFFQGESFKEKLYLGRALEVVREGIWRLGVEKDEPIHVCTGYVLSGVREALEREGYEILPSKIVGATQELAEAEFVRSLVRLGVGDGDVVAGMRSFNSFLDWVLEDLNSRERFVKTGWSSWPRLRGGEHQ